MVRMFDTKIIMIECVYSFSTSGALSDEMKAPFQGYQCNMHPRKAHWASKHLKHDYGEFYGLRGGLKLVSRALQ